MGVAIDPITMKEEKEERNKHAMLTIVDVELKYF